MSCFTRVKCKNCHKCFSRPTRQFNEAVKIGWNQFCSLQCQFDFKIKHRKIVKCEYCQKVFERRASEISKHNYCSRSCSAIVNNIKRAGKNAKKIICENCGKKFKKWVLKNKKYCSKSCQIDAEFYTPEILIKIIKIMAKKIGAVPARRDFRGGVYKACVRIFGSWNNAVKVAGFTPNKQHGKPALK